MKIIIELDDATLRHAVDTQIAKAIAELATERIAEKVDEILTKKFERIDDKRMDEIAGIAAANFLRGDGNRYTVEGRINNALAGAAREMVRRHSQTL